MSDSVPPSLKEVWDWKKRVEDITRSMSRNQLIEFYKKKADEVQQKLKLKLPTLSASDVSRRLRSK